MTKLILDLDETLISSSDDNSNIIDYDFKIYLFQDVNSSRIKETNFKIYIRPFLKDFLIELKDNFEFIIYSAGSYDYVHAICSELSNKFSVNFSKILTRNDCKISKLGITTKYFEKCLLGNNLDYLIIDNSPYVWDNYENINLIEIKDYDYYYNYNDNSLKNLKNILLNNSFDFKKIKEQFYNLENINL